MGYRSDKRQLERIKAKYLKKLYPKRKSIKRFKAGDKKRIAMTNAQFDKWLKDLHEQKSDFSSIYEALPVVEEIAKNAEYFPKGKYVIWNGTRIDHKHVPVGVTPEADPIFKDSLIQARDINPLGAFNYISLICKHKGKYGFWLGEVFHPVGFGYFDAIVYRLEKYHATKDDFWAWKKDSDEVAKDHDRNMDALVLCERSLKND